MAKVCGFLTVIKKGVAELTSTKKCQYGAEVITPDRKCVPQLQECTCSEGGPTQLHFDFTQIN